MRLAPARHLDIILAALAVPAAGLAQDRTVDNNAHGWFTYSGDHPVGNSKWGVHLEGQWRRHDVITKWQQLLLRPGVNYEVNRVLTLTGGYTFVRSYPYGDHPASGRTDEHRLWEQVWLRYRTGKVAWSTRLRFENRFLQTVNAGPGSPPYRHENRFRAWQQIRVPVSKKFYFTAYEEVWFRVRPFVASSSFDQNRAYAALGIPFKPSWRLELGYMNQAVLQRSGKVLESNHTLMMSLFSSARFKRR